jgi:1-acyl-sn-glycerol-3-phosphate acyltransferase
LDEFKNLITIAIMGMFYNFCKWNSKLIAHIFYKNVRVFGAENIPKTGPIVLAATHPNSFLDAMLIGSALSRPTHFLARGDAFNHATAAKILGSLNMLPIYRLSEGKENLSKNNETFDACQAILEANQIVLIFAEGISENNWELRTLKKGTARIAKKAWMSESDSKNLQIIPVGITYEHYQGEGKNILINFGKPIHKEAYNYQKNEALFVKELNEDLCKNFEELAYINKDMNTSKEDYQFFSFRFDRLVNHSKLSGAQIINNLKIDTKESLNRSYPSFIKATLLFWPFYLFCKWLAPKIVKQKIFLDSIIYGLFLILWPLYLVILGLTLQLIFHFI